jgi:23S rRNA (pseudouridine1915-N3)-methyltransferase
MTSDSRRLTFVIGGYEGLSDKVKKRSDIQWSLSPLTFTHDLTRVLLLEQLYRALTIIRNLPYSK